MMIRKYGFLLRDVIIDEAAKMNKLVVTCAESSWNPEKTQLLWSCFDPIRRF